MGFFSDLLEKITGGKRNAGQPGYVTQDGQGLYIYVQCDNCGEKIDVRIRKTSELQRREGSEKDLGPGEFFVHKTIVGSQCYRRIEALIEFDARHNVVDSKVTNGKLITAQEFNEQ